MSDLKLNVGIYKITSPSNKIYIGQSSNIKLRFHHYKSLNCRSQTRLYRSFLKYGVEYHLFEIIILCDKAELNKLERFYQDYYNCLSKDFGLNCVLTKTDLSPCILSDETRELKRLKKLGTTYSDETKLKMSISRRKWKHSAETRLKFSKIHKGKIVSYESREKMSNSSHMSKKVICIDTMKVWNSAVLCARENGYSHGHLCNMLSGSANNKTSFRWFDLVDNNLNLI